MGENCCRLDYSDVPVSTSLQSLWYLRFLCQSCDFIRGGAKMLLSYYIYKGRFLPPRTVAPLHKVEVAAKPLKSKVLIISTQLSL
jgi:hypothetical protein